MLTSVKIWNSAADSWPLYFRCKTWLRRIESASIVAFDFKVRTLSHMLGIACLFGTESQLTWIPLTLSCSASASTTSQLTLLHWCPSSGMQYYIFGTLYNSTALICPIYTFCLLSDGSRWEQSWDCEDTVWWGGHQQWGDDTVRETHTVSSRTHSEL